MSKYQRYQPVISRNSDSTEDNWLSEIDKQLQKDAVQPRSVDQNLFHQINNIINNTKSKYPSVEAAVEDMKNRSGFSAHLDKLNKTSENDIDNNGTTKKAQNLNILDSKIEELKSTISSEEWFNAGKLSAEIDKLSDGRFTNAMDSIINFKYFKDPVLSKVKIPIIGWKEFALGYSNGANFSPEDAEKQVNFVQSIAEKYWDKRAAVNNKTNKVPDIIKDSPSIKNTLENIIKDTKGTLPIPAILEKVKQIHYKDVVEPKGWDDEKLIRLISYLNLKEKQNNPISYESHHNLGTREVINESDFDLNNTDAFHALNPVKF